MCAAGTEHPSIPLHLAEEVALARPEAEPHLKARLAQVPGAAPLAASGLSPGGGHGYYVAVGCGRWATCYAFIRWHGVAHRWCVRTGVHCRTLGWRE